MLKPINPEVHLEVYSKEIIRNVDRDLYQLPFIKHIPCIHQQRFHQIFVVPTKISPKHCFPWQKKLETGYIYNNRECLNKLE